MAARLSSRKGNGGGENWPGRHHLPANRTELSAGCASGRNFRGNRRETVRSASRGRETEVADKNRRTGR